MRVGVLKDLCIESWNFMTASGRFLYANTGCNTGDYGSPQGACMRIDTLRSCVRASSSELIRS